MREALRELQPAREGRLYDDRCELAVGIACSTWISATERNPHARGIAWR